MNKIISILIIGLSLALAGCNNSSPESSHAFHFAIAAEYPPFEYQELNTLKGFDVDLARLVAHELGKEAVFDNMQFSSILPALTTKQVDAAISTITITAERKQQVDLTDSYFHEGIAVVYKQSAPIQTSAQLAGKTVAAQLGSTMEIWLKKNAPNTKVVSMDNNNQSIAALQAGHVDAVLMDGAQGLVFSRQNGQLAFAIIAQSEDGYGIALPKDSQWTIKINAALKTLKEKGEIDKLQKKWLGDK
jgi:polar amino acid transport system substrate-binding protein